MLVAFGADLNPLNHEQKTPLDLSVGKFATLDRSESVVEILPIPTQIDPASKEPTKYLNETGILLSQCGAVYGKYSTPRKARVGTFVEMTMGESEEKGGDSHFTKRAASHTGDNWCEKVSKICFEVETNVKTMLEDVDQSLVHDGKSVDVAASLGLQIREMRLLQMAGSRILFLDGGGMRGLLEIEMLSQIEKRTGRRIVELFDWIVGTSTGAVIALGLVYGEHEWQK